MQIAVLELALRVAGPDFIRTDASARAAFHRTAMGLLKAGASPKRSSSRTDDGKRALDVAACIGDVVLFDALLAAGADPKPLPFVMGHGVASLGSAHYLTIAIERAYEGIIMSALRAGVSVETRSCDQHHQTLLHTAAALAVRPMVELLLSLGANPNAFYESGGSPRTALDASLAQSMGNNAIADRIRAAGGLTAIEVSFGLVGKPRDPALARIFEHAATNSVFVGNVDRLRASATVGSAAFDGYDGSADVARAAAMLQDLPGLRQRASARKA